jgi:hypothetical protein
MVRLVRPQQSTMDAAFLQSLQILLGNLQFRAEPLVAFAVLPSRGHFSASIWLRLPLRHKQLGRLYEPLHLPAYPSRILV